MTVHVCVYLKQQQQEKKAREGWAEQVSVRIFTPSSELAHLRFHWALGSFRSRLAAGIYSGLKTELCRTSQDGSPAGAARALTFEAPIRPYGSARRGLRAQGVQSIFLEWWCRSEHCRCLLRPYSACACTPTRVITHRAAPCRFTGASGPPALGEGGHSRANIRAAGGVCE